MEILIFCFITSVVITIAFLVISFMAFLVHRRQALRYEQLEQKLPRACYYDHLEELIVQAEKDFEELRDRLADAKTLVSQRELAEKWLDENRNELLKIEGERKLQEQLRTDLTNIQNQLATKSSETQKIILEYETTEFKLKKSKDELEIASKKLDSLQDRTSALQKEKDVLDTEIIKMNSDIVRLDKDIDAAIKKLEELSVSIETDGVKLDAIRVEHSKLSAEINGMKEYREQLQTIIKTLKSDYERQLTKVGTDKSDGTADIWQPILRKDDFKSKREDIEQEALDNTSRYLIDLGLKFHKRVLYAFHTALKVQDISPLCVLAGISGTGKSLIPQRYAEAMGIHFLNLAVQPRWDSPQDMFGFYNYLENKYRATEFARALVQMDQCWNEGKRGWHKPKDWNHSLADRMLLVLVDEMNLARVEYYFSEFLSKLESRRTIVNKADASQRRNAEISLEVSKNGTGDQMMQLLVDTNVLIVGTINEDESTQTLSDKVVDRANILRFGKPVQLNIVPSTSSPIRSQSFLGYDEWKEWIKTPESLGTQDSQKINAWIERLNGAMSMIQRPFAFRTHRAIRTYIANYPRWNSKNYLEAAMVDQVEQKILPKLRGLDPSEPHVCQALESIIGLLNDLGDESLSIVLRDNMRYHQFVWQGIDRFGQE